MSKHLENGDKTPLLAGYMKDERDRKYICYIEDLRSRGGVRVSMLP
jgi:hypothetical protein